MVTECILLVKLLQAQEKFTTPIGKVLKKMGDKLPETHLIGSPTFLKWVKRRSKHSDSMIRIGKKMDAQHGRHLNEMMDEPTPLMHKDQPVF